MNRKSQKEIQVKHMVRQFLQNEDTGYRVFHSNLLPGVDNVMGIRLFAKQLSGMDWQEWFEQADDQWYEEMLRYKRWNAKCLTYVKNLCRTLITGQYANSGTDADK